MSASDPALAGAPRRRARRPLGLAVLGAGAVLALAPGARAQGDTCEQFKDKLAARIAATGARGFGLEIVPAARPVPPGAKVVGTCEGGARRVIYRRWAGAADADAAAATPAAALVSPPASRPATAPPPPARRERTSAAPAATPSTAPASAAATASRATPASTPVSMPVSAAATPGTGITAAARGPVAAASGSPSPGVAALALSREPTPSTFDPNPTQREASADAVGTQAKAPAAARIPAGGWLAALLIAGAVVALWLWRVRFGAYDRSGLPRGPRL